jgi:hypothetical protein
MATNATEGMAPFLTKTKIWPKTWVGLYYVWRLTGLSETNRKVTEAWSCTLRPGWKKASPTSTAMKAMKASRATTASPAMKAMKAMKASEAKTASPAMKDMKAMKASEAKKASPASPAMTAMKAMKVMKAKK